jgi:hypothetical protein
MGLWGDQLAVAPIKINKNHVIPDAASDKLRSSAWPPQATIRTDFVILLAYDEHGLADESDPHRITTAWNRRDEIDEVPSGAVGRGHLAPEDSVVR